MKALKVTGIILLIATLLVSGGLYFNNNATIKQQQTAQAQTTDDEALNGAGNEDEFDALSEPIIPEDQNQTNQDGEASVNSIPGIQGASRQMISIQQQIEGRMITCVQNAQRTRGIFANLRAQEAQLNARRAALTEQINQIDASTPAGRERRERLQDERDRVEDQRERVRDQGSDVRRSWTQFKSACRRDINDLRRALNRAQSSLHKQFNSDVNVRFYN